MIMEHKNLRKLSTKFTNKAIPRDVRVKEIQALQKIDLVVMNKMSVIYKGKTYKYICSLLDIFHVFIGYRS